MNQKYKNKKEVSWILYFLVEKLLIQFFDHPDDRVFILKMKKKILFLIWYYKDKRERMICMTLDNKNLIKIKNFIFVRRLNQTCIKVKSYKSKKVFFKSKSDLNFWNFFLKSQSRDLLEKNRKVQVMTLTCWEKSKKSKSWLVHDLKWLVFTSHMSL